MKKKIIFGLILLVAMQTNLISCSKSNNEVKESRFYSVTIDGDKKYISEDSEESKKIEEFVKLFISYGVESNYKNDNYLKEIDIYEESVKQTLEELDYLNGVKEHLVSNEIVIKVNSYDIDKAEIHKQDGNESAKVYVNYEYTYEHATDDFIAESGNEIGKSEKKSVYIDLIKENNEWKMVSSGVI